MYVGLHVKYLLFLSHFSETLIFWTNFLKILKYQTLWKSVQCKPSCSTLAGRQTDRQDEANSCFFASLQMCL